MMRERLAASGTFRVWALVRRDDYDGRMYAGVESYVAFTPSSCLSSACAASNVKHTASAAMRLYAKRARIRSKRRLSTASRQ
jgi:hypothetical protein